MSTWVAQGTNLPRRQVQTKSIPKLVYKYAPLKTFLLLFLSIKKLQMPTIAIIHNCLPFKGSRACGYRNFSNFCRMDLACEISFSIAHPPRPESCRRHSHSLSLTLLLFSGGNSCCQCIQGKNYNNFRTEMFIRINCFSYIIKSFLSC